MGADNRVMLKTVTIAYDLGKEIEISSGLAANDRVIETPPDAIASGDQVRLPIYCVNLTGSCNAG